MSQGFDQQQATEIDSLFNREEMARMADDDGRRVAEELRRDWRAVRCVKRQLNLNKSFTVGQRVRVARDFEAKHEQISARKKILNVKNDVIREAYRLVDEAYYAWRGKTIDYPETGVRLVRVSDVGKLERKFAEITEQIHSVEAQLDAIRDELMEEAKARLGHLYNKADYPSTFRGAWTVRLEYPSVEPDARLSSMHPAIYEREQRRVRERFEAAVAQAENEFISELAAMVAHLADKMKPDADGKRKMFKASQLETLNGFFDRFRALSLHSNPVLESVVDQAQQVVAGVTPKAIRSSEETRQQLRESMETISSKLESLMVDKPKRAISFDEE